MYFGAGCFWHVQHEFILFESQKLGRSGATFSAVSGYAGGQGPEVYKLGKGGPEKGLVCYHNFRSVAECA